MALPSPLLACTRVGVGSVSPFLPWGLGDVGSCPRFAQAGSRVLWMSITISSSTPKSLPIKLYFPLHRGPSEVRPKSANKTWPRPLAAGWSSVLGSLGLRGWGRCAWLRAVENSGESSLSRSPSLPPWPGGDPPAHLSRDVWAPVLHGPVFRLSKQMSE